MSQVEFPPVEAADETGLLGVGGLATPDNLLEAYRRGIFPWPWSEQYIAWFAPPERALLFFDSVHYSRSLQRVLRKHAYDIRIDTCFDSVIEGCRLAKNRTNQRGTWITRDLADGYRMLHARGYAHSIEVFQHDELVGGLYGVSLGKYFSGESMFHVIDNASKVALASAIEFLRGQGLTWMDCQVLSSITSTFGAIEVSRDDFGKLLESSVAGDPLSWPRGSIQITF